MRNMQASCLVMPTSCTKQTDTSPKYSMSAGILCPATLYLLAYAYECMEVLVISIVSAKVILLFKFSSLY